MQDMGYKIVDCAHYAGRFAIVISDAKGWLRYAIGFLTRDDARDWVEECGLPNLDSDSDWQLSYCRREFGYHAKH